MGFSVCTDPSKHTDIKKFRSKAGAKFRFGIVRANESTVATSRRQQKNSRLSSQYPLVHREENLLRDRAQRADAPRSDLSTHPLIKRTCPIAGGFFLRRRKAGGENEGGYYGDGARHRRKARNKLLKSPGMKNQWRVTLGTGRVAGLPSSIYIGGGGSAGGRWADGGGRREEGDSVNGILLGHPFTRTRRKLEDLIWRAVWIAFALAMPPIEPSVIYVHIHTRITRAHLYTQTHRGM